MPLFIEFSAIVFITTGIAALMRLFKQPLIVGYILSGIIVGPYALNILQATADIELFSKIGISILLFIVGLSLNPETIKETGKASLVTGLGQIIFTALIGFLVLTVLGFDGNAASYGAIALTFSSTIIVLKLLSDKGDVKKLYGKISIGFLLIQDLAATIILLFVSVLGKESSQSLGVELGLLLIKGIVVAGILYMVSKYLLPKLSTYIAQSQELLFLFSIAWGLGLAALFYKIGFSIEIGALIAGVTLSVSSYAYEIGSRMKPLRDFFVVLFFVLLGSQLALDSIGTMIVPAIVLSIFVLVGKPIIVMILMNFAGYRTRTGFLAGLTTAQISEFSLILIALGLSLGQITAELASLITLIGIITIAGSTYLMLSGDALYSKLQNKLKIFEFRTDFHRESHTHGEVADIIIFGYDRVGSDFVLAAKAIEAKYLVVDFNPKVITQLQKDQIPFRFGDAEDIEFLEEIELASAKMIVSTIPDFKANDLLVQYYRKQNPTGIIIVIAHHVADTEKLYLSGATYVVMPHHLGAHHASAMIEKYGFDVEKFDAERNKHLNRLEKRS